jgi:hypothetical protein
LITGDARFPDPNKIAKTMRWVRPETGKQIMSFLGFINYLRDYVPLYAAATAPLEELRRIKKLTDRDWTPIRVDAYESIKKILASPIVIQPKLPGLPLFIACDASQLGIGAVCYQIVDKQRRYIAFASRSLNKSQRNYSATRRELLALVFALQRFRYYIDCQHFTLLTDHRALTYLMTQADVGHMLSNWLEMITEFSFDVIHCPGVLNVLPDSLSRQYPEFIKNPIEIVSNRKISSPRRGVRVLRTTKKTVENSNRSDSSNKKLLRLILDVEWMK